MSTLHELIKYGSFFGGSGGSSGGDWELLADMEFAEDTVNVRFTHFPDGGDLNGLKRLFLHGVSRTEASDTIYNNIAIKQYWYDFSGPQICTGGLILAGGVGNKGGTCEFYSLVERVGDYLTIVNTMSSYSNTYQAPVYKTGYNDSRTGLVNFYGEFTIGDYSGAKPIFGPGSTLKIWAIRDK